MEVEVRQDQHGIMEVEAAFGGEEGKIKKIIPIGDSPMSLYFAHVVAWQRDTKDTKRFRFLRDVELYLSVLADNYSR